jgi:hypothetical protein
LRVPLLRPNHLNALAADDNQLTWTITAAALIVADMTATTFCDSKRHALGRHCPPAGGRSRRGHAAGDRHPGVRRVFALSSFDTVISIYPNLPAALSGTADTMAGGAS